LAAGHRPSGGFHDTGTRLTGCKSGWVVASRSSPVGVSDPAARVLALGPVSIDLITDRLVVHGQERHIGPTPLRLLKYLLARAGRVVARGEIERHVLRAHHRPESSTLRNHIADLREALGEEGDCVCRLRDGWAFLPRDAAEPRSENMPTASEFPDARSGE